MCAWNFRAGVVEVMRTKAMPCRGLEAEEKAKKTVRDALGALGLTHCHLGF